MSKRQADSISAIRQDEDSTSVRAVETLFEMLYGASHPYGRRAKGTVESVERITRADLVAFHAERFRPSALSLAIVGHVAAEHALTRAAVELDGWSGASPDGAGVAVAVAVRSSGGNASSTFPGSRSPTSPTGSPRSAASIRVTTRTS